MCPWVGPHAPPLGGRSGGCPAMWSISYQKGYCSRLSGVRPPHPCGFIAGPLCLAGEPLRDCVPACLSPGASMAPDDVCHGRQCSVAGVGPVALEYRSCHWPSGLACWPQCVRPMGCWFFPVPRPLYVCAVSWATWLLFSGVPTWLCCVCSVLGHLAPVHRCARPVGCVVCAVVWATWLRFTAPWCAHHFGHLG